MTITVKKGLISWCLKVSDREHIDPDLVINSIQDLLCGPGFNLVVCDRCGVLLREDEPCSCPLALKS